MDGMMRYGRLGLARSGCVWLCLVRHVAVRQARPVGFRIGEASSAEARLGRHGMACLEALEMKTIKAPNEDGEIIECALLEVRKPSYVLFEDLNDYGAVYSYDADRNVFVRDKFPLVI